MRNMIEVNKTAFNNLILQFHQRVDNVVPTGKRYIKTTTDDERSWIKEGEIKDSINITPNLRTVLINQKGLSYVIFVGAEIEEGVLDLDIVEPVDINAGLVTLLVSYGYLKIDRKSNLLAFYDDIFFQHLDDKYSGHSFQELLIFTEPVSVFHIPKNSILSNENLNRVACFVFSNNPSQLILNFNSEVLKITSELSLVGSSNISYGIILGYLFSTTYKHAFLEVYRLIERLFPINYLKEFHEVSDTKLSFLEFSSALESITSWRPKEEDAIEKIFTKSTDTIRNYFSVFLNSSAQIKALTDYKYFYSLRNSIVHFRANHEEFNLRDDQWNLLLIATLYLLDEQYSRHNNILKG